jgi:hypothetical protein
LPEPCSHVLATVSMRVCAPSRAHGAVAWRDCSAICSALFCLCWFGGPAFLCRLPLRGPCHAAVPKPPLTAARLPPLFQDQAFVSLCLSLLLGLSLLSRHGWPQRGASPINPTAHAPSARASITPCHHTRACPLQWHNTSCIHIARNKMDRVVISVCLGSPLCVHGLTYFPCAAQEQPGAHRALHIEARR